MKVSVVTVCYNAVQTLEKTMLSVLNQTYPDVEYIIIDGGSTDGTVDIIKKYADRLAYWVSEPDKGIYDAMNKGIKVATGEWINFMNAGDTFYKVDTLEKVSASFDEQKADIIYGDVNNVLFWGSKISKPFPITGLTKRMVFSHQSSFVKMSLMKEYEFSLRYRIAGDYNFFYHQYILKKTFLYIPICVSSYDAVYGLSSRNYLWALRENMQINGLINKKFSFVIYYKEFVWFKIRKILKKIVPSKIVRVLKKVRYC